MSFNFSQQSLREEKQIYEKELINLRVRYEEETAHFKDTHSRAVEDLSRKHRAALENTQSISEKEKNRLLSVSELCHIAVSCALIQLFKRSQLSCRDISMTALQTLGSDGRCNSLSSISQEVSPWERTGSTFECKWKIRENNCNRFRIGEHMPF